MQACHRLVLLLVISTVCKMYVWGLLHWDSLQHLQDHLATASVRQPLGSHQTGVLAVSFAALVVQVARKLQC